LFELGGLTTEHGNTTKRTKKTTVSNIKLLVVWANLSDSFLLKALSKDQQQMLAYFVPQFYPN
jgi:hypothetical protein